MEEVRVEEDIDAREQSLCAICDLIRLGEIDQAKSMLSCMPSTAASLRLQAFLEPDLQTRLSLYSKSATWMKKNNGFDSKAVRQLFQELAATKKDAEAMFNVGWLSSREENFAEAKIWFERGREQDHSSCINSLAVLFDKGDGVEKNLKTANELFALAANLGNSNAMVNLGVNLMEDKKDDEAFVLFRKAAAIGNSHAMVS